MKPYWLWTNKEHREYMELTGQISEGRDEDWMECVEPEGVTA